MKINDILTEGFGDLVAHYYPNFDSHEYDRIFNPEAERFASSERKDAVDKVNCDGVNIVTTALPDDDKWSTKPDTKHEVSAGARGNAIIARLRR